MTKIKKELPVKKNQELEVEIVDFTHEGLGVGKVDGYPLFIENAIPGEKVMVQVLKVGKSFGFARVLTWSVKSPDRVEDVDQTLIRTGIAPLHHMTYERQLQFKHDQVQNCMERIAKLPEIEVLPTIGMEDPLHYRNKAQVPIRRINDELEVGFYRKNSHDLVPITDFYIQDKKIDEALVVIKNVLAKHRVKAYNEQADTGNLKTVMIRKGHFTNEMMIVFVTKKKKFFHIEMICQEIKEALPEVVSIMQNVHPEKTNVLLSDEFVTLSGQEYIKDFLLGKTYHISARSFYQINSVQTELLYKKAIELANLRKSDIVMDAYCGIGTIGISLADQVKEVYGIEVVKEAIQDAKVNAALNNLENIEFHLGKSETIFPELIEKGINANIVFVDPPRKGLDEDFIRSSVEMNPDKIVYISCNPATLARDIAIYKELGYATKEVQPVDMFPQTSHVESVTLLQRTKGK